MGSSHPCCLVAIKGRGLGEGTSHLVGVWDAVPPCCLSPPQNKGKHLLGLGSDWPWGYRVCLGCVSVCTVFISVCLSMLS